MQISRRQGQSIKHKPGALWTLTGSTVMKVALTKCQSPRVHFPVLHSTGGGQEQSVHQAGNVMALGKSIRKRDAQLDNRQKNSVLFILFQPLGC